MKKTKFNTKRSEVKKQIKENPAVNKKAFNELVRRASQPLKKKD